VSCDRRRRVSPVSAARAGSAETGREPGLDPARGPDSQSCDQR